MTPAKLRARLAAGPLLLDGGLGSLLIAEGLEPGRAPEWWLLERPGRVAAVHAGYVAAGSDVIATATFGASPPKLASAGLAGRCRELNELGARLAREAAREAAQARGGHGAAALSAGDAAAAARPGAAGGAPVLVAGDIGPTGLLLPPVGGADEARLEAAFAEQAEALAGAGVDLLLIETMYDRREALAAVRAARRTGLPALACLTFEARRRGWFTVMGDALVPSLQELAAAGADAVGFNCSVTSEVMVAMVVAAAPQVGVPLIAQPNAGQPRATPAGVVYDADPAAFARDLAAMADAGARLLGGCCGTTPAFIAAARRALDERSGR